MADHQQWWPAPGKLNLFLHITGQRPDGYHALQTVFQFVELADRIRLRVDDSGEIRAAHQNEKISPEDDLTLRAARLLQQASGASQGAEIELDKRLPIGGGVGGGSSDAATVLLALNRLWDTGLSAVQLAELGLQLGADVPVFVHGHSCWAEGVGEIFREIDVPTPFYLLIDPQVHVSTAAVFSDPELTRNTAPIRIADFLNGDTGNDCEAAVRRRYAPVDEAMRWLDGHASARLTGTGGCVFAAFQNEAEAAEVARQCPDQWRAYVTRGCNRSPLQSMLQAQE